MKHRIVAITLLVVCLVVHGCAGESGWSPPIVYGPVFTVLGDRGNLHRQAGLYYTIRNETRRVITTMEAVFSLFDDVGTEVPGPGDNMFSAGISLTVPPGETSEICVSLDACDLPTLSGLVVGLFYIRRIEFDSGPPWYNAGGYALGSDR
ncbi:MAG: hypothetical protein E4H09_03375 [Spirochaetales bacterium]|nr:MAG: hypothetical protein E4H09_03375 [Spirochaetales bacterium]